MTRLNDTHQLIAGHLSQQPMTVAELAQVIGRDYFGIQSAINGMWRRGEVARIKGAHGTPYKFRLKGRVAA